MLDCLLFRRISPADPTVTHIRGAGGRRVSVCCGGRGGVRRAGAAGARRRPGGALCRQWTPAREPEAESRRFAVAPRARLHTHSPTPTHTHTHTHTHTYTHTHTTERESTYKKIEEQENSPGIRWYAPCPLIEERDRLLNEGGRPGSTRGLTAGGAGGQGFAPPEGGEVGGAGQ